MQREKWDAVVIGSGMGGVITGAILAKREGMKVLVLEKLPVTGGRVISFGKNFGSDYTADEVKDLLLRGVYSTVVKSYPDFTDIIEKKKILKDYIIDGGWHGMSAGDRCRYALIAKSLGKTLPVSWVVGFAYWEDGRWIQLNDLVKRWPLESQEERKRVAYERSLLSNEDASKLDHVDLQMYLESVTRDKNVQDYYSLLGRWQSGPNTAKRVSAGEWIKCNNATVGVGRHLIGGGGMGEVTGGFKLVTDVFESIITENGGEVRTNCKVEEILIKDWQATGVVVDGPGGRQQIDAKKIISNLPAYQTYTIIDKSYFPKELQRRISDMYPLGGVLGNISLKEPLEKDFPKAQFLINKLPGTENLGVVGGQPCFGWEQTSLVDPSRTPEGRCLIQFSVFLNSRRDPDEISNQPLVEACAEAGIQFLRNTYPKFDDILDWYFVTKQTMNYGVEPAPGIVTDRRLPVKHPTVQNLFFTGDTVTQSDFGSNGAAHGAALCACAVSGIDHLKILPPYWR
jgi:hypothetical protein